MFDRTSSLQDAIDPPAMTDQIVITEKLSQAKDVRVAVGSRYGKVLPAEGHLLDLCKPEDINPAWKRWSTELLKPEGHYGVVKLPPARFSGSVAGVTGACVCDASGVNWLRVG